jgi:hypothetical protein
MVSALAQDFHDMIDVAHLVLGAPIINKYWVEDSFPFELLPSYKELNIAGLACQEIVSHGTP